MRQKYDDTISIYENKEPQKVSRLAATPKSNKKNAILSQIYEFFFARKKIASKIVNANARNNQDLIYDL